MSGIHLSQEELSEKIKSHFHWRSIDADVTTTIEICDQCIPSTVNNPGDTVWKKVSSFTPRDGILNLTNITVHEINIDSWTVYL